MNISKNILVPLACALIISGCAGQSAAPPDDDGILYSSSFQRGYYAEEDLDEHYSEEDAVKITLGGASAEISGSGASADGSTVTINGAGLYILSGRLEDGQLIVSAGDSDVVRVVLDNASIHCSDSAPIFVKSCEKAIFTLAEGSVNLLSDGGEYLFPEGGDEPSAALFSKSDMTINGGGSLEVRASYDHGIQSKDNLVIINGALKVSSEGDAVRGKDSVTILDGSFELTAGGDGIQSNNDEDPALGYIVIDGGSFVIDAANDGIQAETGLAIAGGLFDLTTGGGSGDGILVTESSFGGDFGGGFGGAPGGFGNGEGRRFDSGMPQGGGGRPDMPPDGLLPPRGMPQGGMTRPETPDIGDMTNLPGADAGPAPPEQPEASSDSMKGLKSGVELEICGGSFILDCKDDAIHTDGSAVISDGSFEIRTDDDALHAEFDLDVSGGSINVARCLEGFEAANVSVSGGESFITAFDDAVNASSDSAGAIASITTPEQAAEPCSINFSGGTVVINASGDGIDSNGNITMSGGTVIVNGPAGMGNGSIDYDLEFELTGGTLITAGSQGMAQLPGGASTQPTLAIHFTDTVPEGSAVNLLGPGGELLLSFAPEVNSRLVTISSPQLAIGQSYTLSLGKAGSEQRENGVASSVEDAGERLCTVTLSETVTEIRSDGAALAGQGWRRFGVQMEPGGGRGPDAGHPDKIA